MLYRPEWLSEGAEALVEQLEREQDEQIHYDVAIVGSGYGGAVAAARLAGALAADGRTLRVCVLERGREYVPGAFPSRFADLPGHVRFSRFDDPQAMGRADGLFDFRVGKDVGVLLGGGLGGGSLVNAGVAERAEDDVFRDPAWPAALRSDKAGRDAAYAKAERMLGAQPFAGAAELPKHRALGALAAALGEEMRPARIAVTTADGVNAQGVEQRACNRCGDCVTGCNFLAKNTLAMNYLPEAKRRGARLYTGATVSHVSRAAARWEIHFELTARRAGAGRAKRHVLRAAHVVLAAGCFGSTEILKRSQAKGLALSRRLGTRFSGNGDMISVLYGQDAEVNAAPEEHVAHAERGVGPTITGLVVAGAGGPRSERTVFEELAIPAPLRRIFEEVLATGGLLASLERWDGTKHGHGERNDPAAVDPGAIERSQVFAAMGDDGAGGALELVPGWERAGPDGSIKAVWDGAGATPVYGRQDRRLRKSERLGGLYLRNPLWRPLPEALSGLLAGPRPDGKLFSVHPLGGCPMGEDAESGVVDQLGRVFDPAGGGVHSGLLVLDGSIVPAALGINPLLTIAALAERAAERYLALQGWKPFAGAVSPLPPIPVLPVRAAAQARPTSVRLAERMTGDLQIGYEPSPRKASLEVVFSGIRDVRALLRDAGHEIGIERGEFRLAGAAPVAVRGRVYWMERAATRPLGRMLSALWTWGATRLLPDFFQRVRERGWRKALAAGANFMLLARFASHVGEVRHLRYELDLQGDVAADGRVLLPAGTHVRGVKTFRYSIGGNPWRQLSELAVDIAPPGGPTRAAGRLEIDLMHFLKRFAVQFQITAQQDQPGAVLDLASVALFLARIVLKIHVWNFRLPEYEKYDPEREQRRMPGDLPGLDREAHAVAVTTHAGAVLELPLTRYRAHGIPAPAGSTPALLLHGFGASGGQFATARLRENLVQHLAGRGLDVWVAELRTSIAVPHSRGQWRLDDVAKEDVPAIVDAVLAATGHRRLDVVAHCIGSAMFCTAVLAGRLQDGGSGGSKVRRAALLQVGPLITLSTGNKFRGYLAAFLRRYARVDHVDSSVDDRADAADALLDRVLSTYPYSEAEQRYHDLCPPWRAHTHIANCNRSAAVFGRLFEHANLDNEVLDALDELLGHTNLTTFEQTVHYAFYGRLTDYDATNAYVTHENVRKYFAFPVRFLHGRLNDVFDPQTTRRSLRLLRAVHGDDHPCDRVVLRGYGHLDPLVGKSANVDVFPRIAEFLLDDRKALPPSPEPVAEPTYFLRRPLLGPVLGWVRRERGRWRARVWCRADDTQANPSFMIAVPLRDGAPVPGTVQYGKVDAIGIDSFCVVDVELPDPAQGTEIVLVGAYRIGSADPPPRLHRPRSGSPNDGSGEPVFLSDEVAKEVLKARAAWLPALERGVRARRTCDPGYDERPDSVVVGAGLLERLETGDALTFAVASCRFPASLMDREQADALFARLRSLIDDPGVAPERRPSLLALTGDQIYADATAGLFDPKNRRQRFSDCYREAWSAPNAREVLRRIPTYMMLDDHEIGDNWHPEDPDTETRRWGLEAAVHHQLTHSPLNARELCGDARVPASARPLFYAFEAGGFPFFVCDTRTERVGRSRIVSTGQMSALRAWLDRSNERDPGRPKFVVSPSVVAPFLEETQRAAACLERSDGWDGFKDSLGELFSFIAGRKIRNVVFLCGDSHFSMASEIRLEDPGTEGPVLRALCVVSSPLYAPFPFVNGQPEEYLLDNAAQPYALAQGVRLKYRVEPGSVVAEDNFSALRVAREGSGWRVEVSTYCREGLPVVTTFNL